MGRFRWAAVSLLAIGAVSISTGAAAATGGGAHAQLEIYFIDVEGGQSTLVVTPDRHSLLIDTGFAGDGSGFRPGDPAKARDANRIVAAARDAGIDRIDYLLITHFHTDHDGGVTELVRLLPIRTFVDHEAPSAEALSTSAETKQAFTAYQAVRGENQHITPKPGDRLPLQDIEASVVSSAAATLPRPMSGAGEKNAACSAQAAEPRDQYENPRSTGVVIRYGKFRFLDVGDLTGQPLFRLACPTDLVGPLDAYLVAHHGGPDTMIGETLGAWKPRVAILNNGQTKGGAQETYQALHHVTGLEDVWQLHAASAAGESNFPPQYIANLDESTASWLKLIASADGSFRMLNQRTGQWKHYPARAQ